MSKYLIAIMVSYIGKYIYTLLPFYLEKLHLYLKTFNNAIITASVQVAALLLQQCFNLCTTFTPKCLQHHFFYIQYLSIPCKPIAVIPRFETVWTFNECSHQFLFKVQLVFLFLFFFFLHMQMYIYLLLFWPSSCFCVPHKGCRTCYYWVAQHQWILPIVQS